MRFIICAIIILYKTSIEPLNLNNLSSGVIMRAIMYLTQPQPALNDRVKVQGVSDIRKNPDDIEYVRKDVVEKQLEELRKQLKERK
jgi:hypothetical protein